jgi:hypothetical protein
MKPLKMATLMVCRMAWDQDHGNIARVENDLATGAKQRQ